MEGDTIKAIEVLDLSIEKMPIKDFGHFSLSVGYPEMYYKLGEEEKARKSLETLFKLFNEQLIWYAEFPANEQVGWLSGEIEQNLYLMISLLKQVNTFDSDKDYLKGLEEEYEKTFALFSALVEE